MKNTNQIIMISLFVLSCSLLFNYGCGTSSSNDANTAPGTTGLYIHLEGSSSAVTSLEVDGQTQLFVTYRKSNGSTDLTLSTSSWFCDTTIGTVPATGDSAGRFTGMYLGTGEITAVTNRGTITQEVIVYENATTYTAPTTFNYLAYDFDAMWANWNKNTSAEAILAGHVEGTGGYFTDMADPFMSWFYWRVHTHTEGSMKWYLGSYDEYQSVRAVADGTIVYANYGTEDFSNRVVTIEGTEYMDDIYVGLKITYGAGANDYVVAEYGHILCKKSIYDNPNVAVNNQGEDTVHGSGLSVNAGDVIGLWGNTRYEFDSETYENNGFGGDFVVTDPQAKHPKLALNHKNYQNVNPTLFYAGTNAESIATIRTSLETMMQTGMTAPFVQPGGIGEIGDVNHPNKLWGFWYNKAQLENGKQGQYFNMATAVFINEAQTNSDTFSMPSGGNGMYCEDATAPGETKASEYWWDVEVFKSDEGEIFGPYCYTSIVFLESGDEGAGVIKIIAPNSSGGSGLNLTSPLKERWAKFEIVSTNANDWRDDILKIKYFDSLSEASSGSLIGSIHENDNYYEFRKSLYGLY